MTKVTGEAPEFVFAMKQSLLCRVSSASKRTTKIHYYAVVLMATVFSSPVTHRHSVRYPSLGDPVKEVASRCPGSEHVVGVDLFWQCLRKGLFTVQEL
jgi:hypothetical protein